jgi:ribonuclease HI
MILVLDANARTQSEKAGGDLARLSVDQKAAVSARGRRMLSAWKRSQLVIINGTQLEDVSPGRFTSIKKAGEKEATVDYAVVSDTLVPMVQSLSVALPVDPKEAWSDHVSLTIKMDRSILDEAPQPTRRPVREPPVMPQGNPEMDKFCEEVMQSRQNPAEMLRHLYGQVFIQTNFVQVYVQGSSKGAGTENPKGVAAVFWGETSTSNRVLSIPGPEPPSNNRAAIYAALLAVKTADPNQSLMIFTNSEYTIRHACYWAGKNSQIGWACPNGDLLKDLVYLLAKRRAPTRFVRIERSAKNARADAVWKLAQAGLKNSAAAEKYSPIKECP